MISTEEYIRIWKSTGAELRKPINLGNGLILIKISPPHKITILRQYGNFPWKLNHSDIWTWFDGQKNFSLPTKSKSIWIWLGKIFECEMMMLNWELLWIFEQEDYTTASKEIACGAGGCEY